MENPRKAAKCMDFLSTGEMMDFHRKGGEMGRGSLSTENPHTENRKCGEKGWGDPAKSYQETLRRGDPCGRPPRLVPHFIQCVIAKPVRTLAVAIRTPRPIRRGRRPRRPAPQGFLLPPVGVDASARPSPRAYTALAIKCHREASAHTGCGNPSPLKKPLA